MRSKLIGGWLLFVGLCLCLMSGGLWLKNARADHPRPQIVYSSTRDGNPEIYVMDGDGKNHRRLTANQGSNFRPTWSPDGTKIAFVSNGNGGFIQIHVMDTDGKNPIRLTNAVWDDYPTWSPDGQKIAFSSSPDGKMIPHIAVMDADGENLVMLEGHGTEPSWSPDGGEIAFVSRSDGIEEIYVMGADGHGLKKVTHDSVLKGGPSWSPDGRRIAYWGEDNGFFQVYVVRVDGRNLVRLTHKRGHHWMPAWSPDGRTIAYASAGDGRLIGTIHLMTANGKYLKQLSDVHNGGDYEPDFGLEGLAVSPTSKTTTIWGRLKKLAPSLR